MLRKEDFAVIKALKKRDVYVKDVAPELGVQPKTVSRALRGGSASPAGRRSISKLDLHKATIDRLLGGGVWNVIAILREIQSEGLELPRFGGQVMTCPPRTGPGREREYRWAK
jgi:predicted transcriptional regulator